VHSCRTRKANFHRSHLIVLLHCPVIKCTHKKNTKGEGKWMQQCAAHLHTLPISAHLHSLPTCMSTGLNCWYAISKCWWWTIWKLQTSWHFILKYHNMHFHGIKTMPIKLRLSFSNLWKLTVVASKKAFTWRMPFEIWGLYLFLCQNPFKDHAFFPRYWLLRVHARNLVKYSILCILFHGVI
jgi:hypothetical protein